MSGPRTLCWLALLASACSTEGAGSITASTPDGGAELAPDGGVESPLDAGPIEAVCELGSLPASLSARAGGRVSFTLDPEVDLSEVELSLPDSWRSTIDPDHHVTIRTAPSVGREAIGVRRRCPGASADHAIEVEVSPVFWSTVGAWTPGVDPPGFQQLPELWVDPAFGGRALLFAGFAPPGDYPRELWSYSFDRELWEMRGGPEVIPDHTSGRAAPLAEGGGVLFLDAFSGWPGYGTTFTLARIEYDDEGTHWTRLDVADAPTMASYAGAFGLDRAGARYLAACGLTIDRPHCEVGAFDPVSQRWSWPAVEGEAPSGRYGFAYAFDDETRRLVLFSGAGAPTAADPVNVVGETWALELDPVLRWVRLSTSQEPPPRRNACYALDVPGHRLVVWGGSPDAATIANGVWALDLDRGHEAWTELDVPFEPPARSSCTGASDPQRQRVLFGFGNSRTDVYFDLHALNL